MSDDIANFTGQITYNAGDSDALSSYFRKSIQSEPEGVELESVKLADTTEKKNCTVASVSETVTSHRSILPGARCGCVIAEPPSRAHMIGCFSFSNHVLTPVAVGNAAVSRPEQTEAIGRLS